MGTEEKSSATRPGTSGLDVFKIAGHSISGFVHPYAIENMLEETFHLSDWSISRPADGQQKECYIAKTATFAVFLKLDGSTPVGVLQRLGELGVAPRLLRTGSLEGRSYVLQGYLVGKHPGWRWFTDHLPPHFPQACGHGAPAQSPGSWFCLLGCAKLAYDGLHPRIMVSQMFGHAA